MLLVNYLIERSGFAFIQTKINNRCQTSNGFTLKQLLLCYFWRAGVLGFIITIYRAQNLILTIYRY